MAIGPFASYAPPGVYTKTIYEQIPVSLVASLRIPALIGPSSEKKSVAGIEFIRGSSASADELVANEDVTGRWAEVGTDGTLTYTSSQDGLKTSFQVKNYPIYSGDGTGKETTDTGKVTVTIDGVPTPVLQVDGKNGVITIAPGIAGIGSEVRVSYYSSRTDFKVQNDGLSNQVDVAKTLIGSTAVTYASLNTQKFVISVNSAAPVTVTFVSNTLAAGALKSFIEETVPNLTVTVSGSDIVTLSATNDVSILSGAVVLGFTEGSKSTARNRDFYVSHFPIVDGSNNGTATTDVSVVKVYVDGVDTKVRSVEGLVGKIELEVAPAASAVVKADYYFNTYKNSFEYIPNSQVISVSNVGSSPGLAQYTEGSDWVLVNDGTQSKIVWGSTSTVTAGVMANDIPFDKTRITSKVYPTKVYKEALTGTPDGTLKEFTLIKLPVMSGSTSSDYRNDRFNEPTTSPSDIKVYGTASGGTVTELVVARIEGKKVYLKNAPASGLTVSATYYYDRLVNDEYNVLVKTAGASGTGTYEIKKGSTNLFGVVSTTGSITFAENVCDGFFTNSVTGEAATYNVILGTSSDAGKYKLTKEAGATYTELGVYTALGTTFKSNAGPEFSVTITALGTGSYTIVTGNTFTAQNGSYNYSVPGIELEVSNTSGLAVADSAVLKTYALNNTKEPSVGSSYYLDYEYRKTDYQAKVYTNLRDIVAEFGPSTPENQLSLAARLAVLNGATVVALKQVKRVGNAVPAGSYVFAIDEMKKSIGGTVKPHVIATLSADSGVAQYLKQHCLDMSAPRMDSERMAVVGVGLGTTPSGVQSLARSLNSELMMVVYPDSFVAPITDITSGTVTNRLVDGTFAAAALAGSLCSTSLDVATPVTRRLISGLSAVGRVLDPTEANQVAVSGVTVMESVAGGVQVRHGLTTNVSTVLTRTPSVTMTVQDIQRSLRSVLDPFIGQKFVSSIPTEVEARAKSMFQGKIDQNIVNKLVDLIVYVDQDDPTVLRLEAVYVPVFPLEYIVCNLSIRIRS